MCELLSGWTAHLWQGYCTTGSGVWEAGIAGKIAVIADHAENFRLHILLPLLRGKHVHPEKRAANFPNHAEGALGFCIRI